jgi:hypothetical protein
MLSTQQIFEQTSRYGDAYLWADVTILEGEFGSYVELSRSGNDPNDYIPPFQVRPANGGVFLGFTTEEGVKETPDFSFEDIKKAGASAPQRVQISANKITVNANLYFNHVNEVLKFLVPPGNVLPIGYTFGGVTEPSYHNLLVIQNNLLDPQSSVVRISLYYKGYFKPASYQHSARDFFPLEMQYTAITGDSVASSNACARPTGDQLGRFYWVDVDWATNLNTFVKPDGSPLDPMPIMPVANWGDVMNVTM